MPWTREEMKRGREESKGRKEGMGVKVRWVEAEI